MIKWGFQRIMEGHVCDVNVVVISVLHMVFLYWIRNSNCMSVGSWFLNYLIWNVAAVL